MISEDFKTANIPFLCHRKIIHEDNENLLFLHL